jgi:X-X-X-Leu-X-X-Gly heptad repeat protein
MISLYSSPNMKKSAVWGCIFAFTMLYGANAFIPSLSTMKGFCSRVARVNPVIGGQTCSTQRVGLLTLRAKSEKQDGDWQKFEEGVQQLQQGLQQLQSGLGLAAEGALNSLGKSALVNVESLLGKEELIDRLEAAQSVVLKNIGIGEVIHRAHISCLIACEHRTCPVLQKRFFCESTAASLQIH